MPKRDTGRCYNFYPRSPCGERPKTGSTATYKLGISIHALLAESDRHWQTGQSRTRQFLSTLSLRRATILGNPCAGCPAISIHALLAESDKAGSYKILPRPISIHALLAESDPLADGAEPHAAISIHALLAESDAADQRSAHRAGDFYPRSPCGERRRLVHHAQVRRAISIHALLAESDNTVTPSSLGTL